MCQGTFWSCSSEDVKYSWLFCSSALFCTLFLGSKALISQIFISVVTQCLLNRNIPCFPLKVRA